MRIKLVISYDGTRYYGFQHQNNALNIEDVLLEAIQRIEKIINLLIDKGFVFTTFEDIIEKQSI